MYLVIVTKGGNELKRDVLEEVLRRAKERGGVNEENIRAGFVELESELDAYVRSLKSGEIGPEVK